MLPYVDDDCCRQCGLTCTTMVDAIIQGEKEYSNCKMRSNIVTLKIGDKEISMVPFVQTILKNNVLSIASELNGYQKGKNIELVVHEG
jgi:molybdopterin-guanine dinucleotide biosynthesis protein B